MRSRLPVSHRETATRTTVPFPSGRSSIGLSHGRPKERQAGALCLRSPRPRRRRSEWSRLRASIREWGVDVQLDPDGDRMTTVLGQSPIPAGAKGPVAPSNSRLPVRPTIRRPILAAGSLLVVIASIAIFVSIYSRATHQVEVLEIVRPVARGQMITAADLGSTGVTSESGLPVVPIGRATMVVGQTAAVPLASGTVLVASELSTEQPVTPGDAVVGIALKDGQLPAQGLQPGDAVMVVQTDAPGTAVTAATGSSTGATSSPSGSQTPGSESGESSTGVLVPQARVRDVEQPSAASSGSETELVSVEVSQTLAPDVTVAAAADQISLVLLPQGGGHP
jgi:hypothetical protein